MATKTERILNYLPGTYEVSGTNSPLKTLVNAFGTELLNAENSLAAVLRSHWVDHANVGADKIDDLAGIAALYGLAPRADQDVEEFRVHLKQYIKTALQGPTTVQGILRTTANSLGLQIADSYDELDTWWTRDTDKITTIRHCGNDAATAVFGKGATKVTGTAQTAAQIIGQVDLANPIDLSSGGAFSSRTLQIKINGKAKVTVDLFSDVTDPTAANADEIVAAINGAFAAELASLQNNVLILTALTAGAGSSILIEDQAIDASPIVLGIASLCAKGEAETAASLTGTVDLSGVNDLSQARFLRLRFDNTQLAEIDCAGALPEATSIDEIRDAINADLGVSVASHDGSFLTLKSTLVGISSSITLLSAASNDAKTALLGTPPTNVLGHDKLAAKLTGTPDLSKGVNLSQHFMLRIKVNTSNAVNVDCQGAEPNASQLPEIVNKINDTLGKNCASHNGKNLILSSTTTGTGSKIKIEILAENDAAEVLLGIRARSGIGTDAKAATFTGSQDLSSGLNLMAQNLIRLSVDHNSAIDIDLAATSSDPSTVSISEMSSAINNAIGLNVASHDGLNITLLSQLQGINSKIELSQLNIAETRRFVSRADIIGEAADKIFGFSSAIVSGQDATPALVEGRLDLGRGVDLRTAQYLAIKINDQPTITIYCAGPRPRATLLDEVIENINTALAQEVASSRDGKLTLIAPVDLAGNSRIEFIPPQATDARDKLFATETGLIRGSDATTVIFTGTTDISGNVDLSVNANLNLTIDDVGPLEISCAGVDPGQTTLAQIAIAINVAFARNVATHDGSHLILASTKKGTDSLIEILAPSSADATLLILGINTPRSYLGMAATAAEIAGQVDLTGVFLDLSVQRFIALAVDGGELHTVDCAANATDTNQVSLDEIIDSINTELALPVATHVAGKLLLTSPSTGLSSRIDLQSETGSDAKSLLFGELADIFEGTDPTSAVLESEVVSNTGVDLSERNQLHIKIDGQAMQKIYIQGAKPDQVFVEEVADAINAIFPEVAEITTENRLRITSILTGSQSSIELLPVRYLELEEYLLHSTTEPTQFDVKHGDKLVVNNSGSAEVMTKLRIEAVNGVYGAGLVNDQIGWKIRIFSCAKPGDNIVISAHSQYGVQASITPANGKTITIDNRYLEVGPFLPHMIVPSSNTWRLAKGADKVKALTLNNPLAPNILILTSQLEDSSESHIDIEIKSTNLNSLDIQSVSAFDDLSEDGWLIGQLHYLNHEYHLLDKEQTLLAILLPGEQTNLEDYLDYVVVVTGERITTGGLLHDEILVSDITRLFDVSIISRITGQADITEHYPAATIGENRITALSLQQQFIFNPTPSILVRAVARKKQQILALPKGRTNWHFLECLNSRFDQTQFNSKSDYLGRFAGGFNVEAGLTDFSQYHSQPPSRVSALYVEKDVSQHHKTLVHFEFDVHQAGTMGVNLPVDLAPRFGGRFNQALFSVPSDQPETHLQVVTEPQTDPNYLVDIINANSSLIKATAVEQVPLGFTAQSIPFSNAIAFTNGTASNPAKLFILEPDVAGFIELSAKEAGVWGNQLSVVICESGPAIFDLLVNFPGSRFENARITVLGDAITGVVTESLRPGAMGVRQAKAAGVKVEVNRENCDTTAVTGGEQDV